MMSEYGLFWYAREVFAVMLRSDSLAVYKTLQ